MSVRKRPTARCRALLLELSHYLDGDLPHARARAVERHMRACACCDTMAARLRRTVAACRAEGKRPLPRDVMSRAAKRIRALVAADSPIESRRSQVTRSSKRPGPTSVPATTRRSR